MDLLPVNEFIEDNNVFVEDPFCQDSLYMCIEFYKKVGFNKPWICYYASGDGRLVGSAGFKGKPVDNKIEIAYGTFEPYRNRGIGARICKKLVDLAQETDPGVIITARTLPAENYSTRILKKSCFKLLGKVVDPEDGDVWEWEYKPR